MTLTNLEKTPWPWFGGKSDAAPTVWTALGDVEHYVEPFAGSLAVLMRRPHPCNRTYFSETVNDIDSLLCNAWRSMQMSPGKMAAAASWPVCEADLMSRHLALIAWRESGAAERLAADPTYHDPVMGGWWAWGQSCWIGSGWCSGTGPWHVGTDGRITKQARVGPREPGVSRQIPHLVNNGQGVNRPQAREPGVSRQIPHLGDNGKGVNHAVAREPGVNRKLPHISEGGRGVNRPQAREPVVAVRDSDPIEFHPMMMPELLRWFRFLAARLRHVRILNGDWTRVVTTGALYTIKVREGGNVGVFLDPPYGDVRTSDIYAQDSLTVATEVRAWCVEHGSAPRMRIVLAGFEGEHEEMAKHGWRAVEWYRKGHIKGGMANTSKTSVTQQTRERLWLSPGCLRDSWTLALPFVS